MSMHVINIHGNYILIAARHIFVLVSNSERKPGAAGKEICMPVPHKSAGM